MFDHGHVHFWGSKVLYYWTWPGAFLVWQVPLQQRPLAWKKLCTSQRHQPGSAVSKKSTREAKDCYISGLRRSQRPHLRDPIWSYSFYSGTWLWLAGTLLTLLQRLPSKLLASRNRIPTCLPILENNITAVLSCYLNMFEAFVESQPSLQIFKSRVLCRERTSGKKCSAADVRKDRGQSWPEMARVCQSN